jgi:hypothetical protein
MSEEYRRTVLSKNVEYEVIVDKEDQGLIDFAENLHIQHSENKGGYFTPRLSNNILSRIIMKVSNPDVIIDHINRNTLDNRKCNLRIVTSTQNQFNKAYDPKKYERGIVDSLAKQCFIVNIRSGETPTPIRYFNNNHDAIRYAYPLVQEIQGEYCSDKRTLEEVLRDVEYKEYDRIVASQADGRECPKCKANIKSHYEEHVEKCGRTTECECGAFLSDVYKLENHKKYHCPNRTAIIEFKCSIEGCPHSFSNKDNLARHIRTLHPNGVYVAPVNKTFKCPKCPNHEGYAFQTGLDKHNKKYHPIAKVVQDHQCTQCTKSYGHRDSLVRHIKQVHTV